MNMADKSATQEVVVTRPAGLHARPCTAIATTARRFQSKVTVRHGTQVVDATDVLQLLALGAAQGTVLELSATGPDAEEAIQALAELFVSDFGLGPQ